MSLQSTANDVEGCLGCAAVIGIIAFIVVGIGSCIKDSTTPVNAEERIENVTRVMMHSPNKFTLYIQQSESPELLVRKFEVPCNHTVKVVTDVGPKDRMWALHKTTGTKLDPVEYLEVHIHDPKELNGGEYSTGGKFPQRSQTVPVE
jgi:hypothetical protein